MTTLIEQIAAKEAELAAVKAELDASYGQSFGGSSKRKSFAVRVDASVRRSAERWAAVKRLDGEIASLRRKAERPELPPLDLSRLPFAEFIKTRASWYRVVKVNAKSVKVAVAPGMDDLIKIGQIIAIRERATSAETAA